MTFKKYDDNCWHWVYSEGFQRETSYPLLASWLITIIIISISTFIALPGKELLSLKIKILGIMSFGLTIIFAFILFMYTRIKKNYNYTCTDNYLVPFSTRIANSRYVTYFDNVIGLEQKRNRNGILIKSACRIPSLVYASFDDYEAVWTFLKEHCPGAEIIETSIDGQIRNQTSLTQERVLKIRSYYCMVWGVLSIIFFLIMSFIFCLYMAYETFNPVVSMILQIVIFTLLISSVLAFVLSRKFAKQAKQE